MTIRSQGSFLGEMATRLYRLLGLDGQVQTSVDDTIQPVVIVGDGTQPGMANYRGRRFSGFISAPGAATYAYFTPTEDVIIDRIVANFGPNAGADTAQLLVSVGLSAGSQLWPFVDRAALPNDLAPVRTTNGGTGAAVTDIGLFAGLLNLPAAALGDSTQIVWECWKTPKLVAAGTTIRIKTGTARQIYATVEGRTVG